MTSLLNQEELVNGTNSELTALKTALFGKVIPRYLGPLETEGRTIQPCLIHSDLWPGNIKPMAPSDELCMFDASAYWGHNEGSHQELSLALAYVASQISNRATADLGICRNPRYKLGRPCIREYFKRVPMAEPIEDFDGRNAVYALKFHALLSVMKDSRFRQV
jgi:hypothetical protein